MALESLFQKSSNQLSELYRKGTAPDVDSLGHAYRGCVPAVSKKSLLGNLSRPVSTLSSWGLLPWKGKSFSVQEGRGQNRILFESLTMAPFEFRAEASLQDRNPCVVLDYDIDENFFPLRMVRDEIRTIERNLLLGQMYFKPTASLVLYFALEKQS